MNVAIQITDEARARYVGTRVTRNEIGETGCAKLVGTVKLVEFHRGTIYFCVRWDDEITNYVSIAHLYVANEKI